MTGYHRKHAIRVLTTQPVSEPKARAVRRVYQEAVKEALIVLWEASDRICGKRLKALLPLLVEAMQRHEHLQLQDGVRTQLLAMSAATIDRQLHLVRQRARGGHKKSSATNRVRRWLRSAPSRTGRNSFVPASWKWIWSRIADQGQKEASCILWS